MSADFPLIYCNGDSYSDENYHETLPGKTYANTVGEYYNGFVINKAISGSCNRRIIRTAVHDLILQRKTNPTQQIIPLLGLSFEIRSEIWKDNINALCPEESNFTRHQFSIQVNWKENLLAGIGIGPKNNNDIDEKFYQKYSEGCAYFYSPYAERINLLTDLIMLRSLLESLNINFLIFQSPKADSLESEYLVDFFKTQITEDLRFFDLEQFGFVDWCYSQKFIPLDYLDRPEIGHYGPEAHKAFAEQILLPRLQQLNIV